MKKLFSILFSVIFIMYLTIGASFAAETSKQINANIRTKRVPAGTVIQLKAMDAVNSSTTSLGDRFDLMVSENVIVNNSVVIPSGTVVRGSIEEVQSPQMLYKGGVIRLYFDHIVSSTGRQVSFYAGVCNNPNITYDGALSSKTTYSTAIKQTAENTKNIVVKPTTTVWDKSGNVLNGAPKYVLAPLTAVVCAPVAGIYFVGDSIADIFKRGKDININQGETIQVQLLKPLDMPVY